MFDSSDSARKAQQQSVRKRKVNQTKFGLEGFLQKYFAKTSTHKEIEKALEELSKNKQKEYLDLTQKLLAFIIPRKSQIIDYKSVLEAIRTQPMDESQMLSVLALLKSRLESEFDYV